MNAYFPFGMKAWCCSVGSFPVGLAASVLVRTEQTTQPVPEIFKKTPRSGGRGGRSSSGIGGYSGTIVTSWVGGDSHILGRNL